MTDRDPNPNIKRALFLRAGTLLCGDWNTPLMVELLGVRDYRIRGWASGRAPVPPGVWRDLHKTIAERVAELIETMDQIELNCLDAPAEPDLEHAPDESARDV